MRTTQCMVPKDPAQGAHEGTSRRIIRTLPPSMMRGSLPPSVKADEWFLTYTALGKPFWFFFKYWPAVPEDYRVATEYMQRLPELLRLGAFQPVPHRLMEGGLEGIGQGLAELKAGRVRGEKLVYHVNEV